MNRIRGWITDRMLPIALIIVSGFTHLLYFGNPGSVVFDETYSTKFLQSYWQGSYFFDVHPPLGRIMFAAWSWFTGAGSYLIGSFFDSSVIGTPLPHAVILVRLLPLVAGIVLPLIIYCICRRLGFSKAASFLAGMTLCLENSLITQSRFILTDSLLLIFGFLSVLLYLEARPFSKADEIHSKTKKTYFNYRVLLISSALCAAASFSIKWVGLSFFGLILLVELLRMTSCFKKNILKYVRFAILYCGILVIFYVSVFAAQFALLPHSGPGDAFMTPSFDKTLIGSSYEGNMSVAPRGFFGKLIEDNITMYHEDSTLTKQHPYSSLWYTWPLELRPIYYWHGTDAYIYFIGNPLVYWLGSLCMLCLIALAAWKAFKAKPSSDGVGFMEQHGALIVIVIGFLINFLPFAFIGRVMFLYHYAPALVWSVIGIAYLFDRIHFKKESDTWKAAGAFILVVAVVFIFFAPLTYGLPLSDTALNARIWLHSWR